MFQINYYMEVNDMTKQKKGFWLFIFSLIPGAGEMYMGFRKQGISIMLLFWSLIALASGTGMGWLILFMPILWFYSFFNVHNLKSLSEEEFYSVEDSYILHMDQLVGDTNAFLEKYRTLIAIVLIVFGATILWNSFADILYWILPQRLAAMLNNISYRLPQIIVAIGIIAVGIYILTDKKRKLGDEENVEEEDEHYWEPYRPYQQPVNPEKNEETQSYASAAEVSPIYENVKEDIPNVDTEKDSSSDTTISQ